MVSGPAPSPPPDHQVAAAIAAWTLLACTPPTDRALTGWGLEDWCLVEPREVLKAAAAGAGR